MAERMRDETGKFMKSPLPDDAGGGTAVAENPYGADYPLETSQSGPVVGAHLLHGEGIGNWNHAPESLVEHRRLPDLDEDFQEPKPRVIVVDPAKAKQNLIADAAFYNEPVLILIHPAATENPEPFVHCAVQGVGAEVLDRKTGYWTEFRYLPVGKRLIVKRKYVEVLLAARAEKVQTEIQHAPDGRPQNFAPVTQAALHNVQILKDWNTERGPEWAMRAMKR